MAQFIITLVGNDGGWRSAARVFDAKTGAMIPHKSDMDSLMRYDSSTSNLGYQNGGNYDGTPVYCANIDGYKRLNIGAALLAPNRGETRNGVNMGPMITLPAEGTLTDVRAAVELIRYLTEKLETGLVKNGVVQISSQPRENMQLKLFNRILDSLHEDPVARPLLDRIGQSMQHWDGTRPPFDSNIESKRYFDYIRKIESDKPAERRDQVDNEAVWGIEDFLNGKAGAHKSIAVTSPYNAERMAAARTMPGRTVTIESVRFPSRAAHNASPPVEEVFAAAEHEATLRVLDIMEKSMGMLEKNGLTGDARQRAAELGRRFQRMLKT